MFVAQRELKIYDRQGKQVLYKRGDVIPDFHEWDVHARRANLHLEWVIEEKGETPAKVSSPSPSEEAVEASPETLACGECKKSGFKTARALKIHVTSAHRK